MSRPKRFRPIFKAERPPPGVTAALNMLAASDFDPDDYKLLKEAVCHYCKICGCVYAPRGYCGYCRQAVRKIRTETAQPATKAMQAVDAGGPKVLKFARPERIAQELRNSLEVPKEVPNVG